MTMQTRQFMVSGNAASSVSDQHMQTIADGSTTLYRAVRGGLHANGLIRREAPERLRHLVRDHADSLHIADKGFD